MSATATTDATGANQQTGDGRDARGRFVSGNKGGPGNPFARKVAELRTALVNFVTEDDMKHVAFVLKERAMGGDLAAIKLLFLYVLGKPTETVDPDRLDVDEWEKMQEQARPPAEVQQVMSGLPAGTIADVTKVAWPCAVEQAFNQPFLAGLRRMDERDAKRRDEGEFEAARKATPPEEARAAHRGEARDGRPDRPSRNGGNGRQGDGELSQQIGDDPLQNGGNGLGASLPAWLHQLVSEVLHRDKPGGEAPSRNSANGGL